MDDVTVCVTTFQRPEAAARCVRTLNGMWPDLPVLVADQSRRPQQLQGAEVVQLPFDCGISTARNTLLDMVATRWVVFMDDDFYCSENTRLDWMRDTLEAGEADIVGGMVPAHGGGWMHYHGLLDIRDGVLFYEHGERGRTPSGLPIVDVTLNFIMADTAKLRALRWDDRLKIAEHTDFFLRAKEQGLRVVLDERVRVEHRAVHAPGYSQFRNRGWEFVRIFWDKWGIRESVSFDGTRVTSLPASRRARGRRP